MSEKATLCELLVGLPIFHVVTPVHQLVGLSSTATIERSVDRRTGPEREFGELGSYNRLKRVAEFQHNYYLDNIVLYWDHENAIIYF